MNQRYLCGSKKDFWDFVNLISKEEKIGIITHTDLDGVASGIFLQNILEENELKVNFIEFLDYSTDSLKEILDKEFDVLFFTDWRIDMDINLLNLFRENSKVLVFDHHPINKDLKNKKGIIKTADEYCSAHALFDLAKEKNYFFVKDFEWLVCSAIIMDYVWDNKENIDFLKIYYPEIDLRDIWKYEPGRIAQRISDALIYYYPNIKKVYDLVLEKDLEKLKEFSKIISKEISLWMRNFKEDSEYFPEQNLYFFYGSPKYKITSKITSFLSKNSYCDKIILFASDILDKKGFVKISARTQRENIHLGEVLQNCIKGFENAVAGGHAKASGASFPKKYLENFKENLLRELKNG
ncbi:MAG: DHHA1 domain-containing protein [Nanoarchaeota archaeon]